MTNWSTSFARPCVVQRVLRPAAGLFVLTVAIAFENPDLAQPRKCCEDLVDAAARTDGKRQVGRHQQFRIDVLVAHLDLQPGEIGAEDDVDGIGKDPPVDAGDGDVEIGGGGKPLRDPALRGAEMQERMTGGRTLGNDLVEKARFAFPRQRIEIDRPTFAAAGRRRNRPCRHGGRHHRGRRGRAAGCRP